MLYGILSFVGNRRSQKISHSCSLQSTRSISAFVLSKINYGNSLLAGLPTEHIRPLKRVQHAPARVLTGARRRDHITSHRKKLHWLPIPYRIDFKIAILDYRCLNGSALVYLSNLLHMRSSSSPSRVYVPQKPLLLSMICSFRLPTSSHVGCVPFLPTPQLSGMTSPFLFDLLLFPVFALPQKITILLMHS